MPHRRNRHLTLAVTLAVFCNLKLKVLFAKFTDPSEKFAIQNNKEKD